MSKKICFFMLLLAIPYVHGMNRNIKTKYTSPQGGTISYERKEALIEQILCINNFNIETNILFNVIQETYELEERKILKDQGIENYRVIHKLSPRDNGGQIIYCGSYDKKTQNYYGVSRKAGYYKDKAQKKYNKFEGYYIQSIALNEALINEVKNH